MPAVVTVSNEIGEPRYPTIKGIMGAKKIDPEVWKPGDINDETGQAGNVLKSLYQPVFEGSCEFIEGETQRLSQLDLDGSEPELEKLNAAFDRVLDRTWRQPPWKTGEKT